MLGDPTVYSSPCGHLWRTGGAGHVDETCFGQGADSKSFFDRTAAGSQCNCNWLEGTHEWPSYASDAPALLGFGGASMMEFCLKSIAAAETSVGKLARHSECLRSGEKHPKTQIRLEMCLNLHGVCCQRLAPRPRRTSREIHFSPAPKTLRIDGDPSPARSGHAVPSLKPM